MFLSISYFIMSVVDVEAEQADGDGDVDIVQDLPLACADETAAVELLEELRWGDDPCCPRCGSTNVYKMTKRGSNERNDRFLWRCRDCSDAEDHDQYTVRIGTVMEESKLPLHVWCFAFWRACSSKKGVSALEIKRQTGISYKSALFLMHRIRYAMKGNGDGSLSGTVEVDETYVGGKPRYPGQSKRGRGTNKEAVLALVERDGEVRARHVERVTTKNIREVLTDSVDNSSRIVTDEFSAYPAATAGFKGGHDQIRHNSGEWVRGDVHTNTVESFFAIVKRGINGIFHSVSKRHPHRYLDEFEFRYNTRGMDDGERTSLAIQGAEGKRLVYETYTRGTAPDSC